MSPFKPFIVPPLCPLRVGDVVGTPAGREATVMKCGDEGRIQLRYIDDNDEVTLKPKYLTLLRRGSLAADGDDLQGRAPVILRRGRTDGGQ